MPSRSEGSNSGLAIGAKLAGRYRVLELLGYGGMGVVYAAIDEERDTEVAIKLLRRELRDHSRTVSRFLREARAASLVESPHVVRVSDVATHEDGTPFLVMERLFGKSLATELETRRRLPLGEAVGYLVQAARGAAAAHERGVVHRDLKPHNLFLVDERRGRIVKLLDFGISKLGFGMSGRVTESDTSLGTPAYMSPEQLRSAKHVDARSDVWSLGVIAYELLSGVLPFDGISSAEIARAITKQEPVPLRAREPSIPSELAAAVERALRKHSGDRLRSAALLALALEPFAAPGAAPHVAARTARSVSRPAGWSSVPPPGHTHHDTTPRLPAETTATPRRRLSLPLVATLGIGLGIAVSLLLHFLY